MTQRHPRSGSRSGDDCSPLLGLFLFISQSSITSEHCTKLRVGRAKLCYAGEAGEAGSGYTASFVAVAIFHDTPWSDLHKWARGPKFSGHADIKGHYQRAKFECPGPLRGDSRGGEGKCFSLTPPPSEFSRQFFIFCTKQYGRKIVGSIFEKISLENRKISNFVYLLAGRF